MFRIIAVLMFFFAPLFQQPEFQLGVHRDFGYGAGSKVRGNFSMRVSGDQNQIQAVTYLIDGQEMSRETAAPFVYKFKTSDYTSGQHELTAVVETVDGRKVTTPPVVLNFLSADAQTQDFRKIFIPLMIAIFGIMAVSIGGQFLMNRGGDHVAPGTPRSYGYLGGTICPRCDRPFARHVWGINLVAGKLDRCPYCGKWFLAVRRSPELLAAAEQAELASLRTAESGPLVEGETEEERMKKLLDESKYTS